MARVRIASRAASDLADIAIYTFNTWGDAQMSKYVSTLEQCALRLAKNPKLGRLCDGIYPGLRRFEKEQHVIYYLQEPDGILVARVLHNSMNPARHEFEDEAADSTNQD